MCNLKFSYDEFEKQLKEATIKLFNSLKEKTGIENISGFALYSDEGAGSIVMAFDTFEFLQKNINKNTYNGSDIKEYYRWAFVEWQGDEKYLGQENLLNKLSEILYQANRNKSEEEFIIHCQKIYTICVNVLKSMKEDGFFNGTSKDFILLFGITDSEYLEDELIWTKTLNNNENYNEFEKWRMSWAD